MITMSQTLHHQFCENLRRRMETQNVHGSELARRLNVSRAYVSQILSGRNTPGLDVIERIAAALDCEAYELLMPEKIPA